MASKGRKQVQQGASNQWMISFADLLSLVLTFFVLLFSMSVMEQKQWDVVRRAFSVTPPDDNIINKTPAFDRFSNPRVEITIAEDLDYLETLLNKAIIDDGLNPADVTITTLEDRMVISLIGDNAFDVGASELNKKAQKTLSTLGEVLRNISNRIQVNGYTDKTPINTSEGRYSKTATFVNNWELSLSRALRARDALYRAGYGFAIETFGRGSSPSRHATRTLSPNERDRLGRRIEIIVRSGTAKDRRGKFKL